MEQELNYQDGDVTCHGKLFLPEDVENAPLVLIVHDWSGLNTMAEDYAEAINEIGYAAFAVDMYGNGTVGATNDEKAALMTPLKSDRLALLRRINAAYDAAKNIEGIDASNIACIGFCFGGLVALDLARSGADIVAAVSFHGLLDTDAAITGNPISAKVLALHGQRDPMVSDEQVIEFQKEMTEAGADWQVVTYGNTYHAFMNPEANDPDFGTVYNEVAASRAWDALQLFLLDSFSIEEEHDQNHGHHH